MANDAPAAWVSSLGNTFGAAPPAEKTAFGNPFARADMAAAASQIGTKEDKNSMMAAFSDMGLALGDAGADKAAPSSAKALLAKKQSERQEEQRAEEQRRARRQAQAQPAAKPASALLQALDAFAGEVSQSDTFTAALHGRAGARRARQKAEKAVARGGKSVRDIKRLQRRDRHVY